MYVLAVEFVVVAPVGFEDACTAAKNVLSVDMSSQNNFIKRWCDYCDTTVFFRDRVAIDFFNPIHISF